MIDLNIYKRDRTNNDYFRVVRNDLSLKKRVGSVLTAGAVAGGVGGLILIAPAIAPLVAAPTMATLLSVSTNIVLGGTVATVPVVAHKVFMHKDNVLSKSEKRVQKAAKYELKLQAEDISDKRYAKLSRKRDKKLQKFEFAHDSFERKTVRLAKKLGADYDIDNDELTITNPALADKKGTFLYNRKLKKFRKVALRYRELHEDYTDYVKVKKGEASDEFKANLHKRSVPQKAKRGVSATAHGVASGVGFAFGGVKKVYGAGKGKLSRYLHDDSTMWDADSAFMPKDYKITEFDKLPLFDQLMKTAQMVSGDTSCTGLFKTDGKSISTLQPRKVKNPFVTKEKYLNGLQAEYFEEMPYATHKKVGLQDYVDYYSKTEHAEKAVNIVEEIVEMRKKQGDISEFVEENGLSTLNPQKYVVQLDLDNPNIVEARTFNSVEEAMAYSRLAQKMATKAVEDGNCLGFRITTWEQEIDGTYTPVTALCTKVSDEKEIEESNLKMRNTFIRETRTLHRNAFVMNEDAPKLSTADYINAVEELAGNEEITEEEFTEIFAKMPTIDLNTMIGEVQKGVDDRIVTREKAYLKNSGFLAPEKV